MHMLKELPPKKQRVYVLIGNEPVEACLGRLREVVEWGGEPHAQPFIKLNALQKIRACVLIGPSNVSSTWRAGANRRCGATYPSTPRIARSDSTTLGTSSLPPASSTSTLTSGFSANLRATTEPEDPEPQTMKS
jgi:hypothetical protein